jgi:hypothetical protein
VRVSRGRLGVGGESVGRLSTGGTPPRYVYKYSYGPVGVKTGVTNKDCSTYYSTHYMTSRSGSALLVLADGSVRGVSPTISQTTFTNLLNPQDGNPLGNDF